MMRDSWIEKKRYISVIVPVYQSVKTLNRCLDSILNQTYEYIELILVDDGSTDGSSEICDKYAKEYENVVSIHINNSGPSVARKVGFKHSNCEYVGFVDSDDYIEPTMYEKLICTIIEDGSDFVHSWYRFDSSGQKYCDLNVYKLLVDIPDKKGREGAIKQLLFDSQHRITPSIWSKIYRKDLLKKSLPLMPDTLNYGEDLVFLFACISFSNRVTISDLCEYNYVVRENSLSHLDSEIMFLKELEMYSLFYNVNEMLNLPVKRHNLYRWIREEIVSLLIKTSDEEKKINSVQYTIKDIDKYLGKKIILYGAGKVGYDYLRQMELNDIGEPVAICDSYKKNILWEHFLIINPNEISNIEYDYIIIAVMDEESANKIKQMLLSIGADEKRIIWESPYR